MLGLPEVAPAAPSHCVAGAREGRPTGSGLTCMPLSKPSERGGDPTWSLLYRALRPFKVGSLPEGGA